MATTRRQCLVLVFLTAIVLVATPPSHATNALETYVRQPDNTFAWEIDAQTTIKDFTVTQLKMTSQTWRGYVWTHDVKITHPHTLRRPEIALLFITGDHSGSRSNDLLQMCADRAGAVVAEVTRMPNRPLYDGRKEDALIAYTFEQYPRTGDDTWPALFPMTKSVVRAMDAVHAWANKQHLQSIEKFVVVGASKRGWTTWLTGAIDPRLTAIAPIVIDVLNMKAQMEWGTKSLR